MPWTEEDRLRALALMRAFEATHNLWPTRDNKTNITLEENEMATVKEKRNIPIHDPNCLVCLDYSNKKNSLEICLICLKTLWECDCFICQKCKIKTRTLCVNCNSCNSGADCCCACEKCSSCPRWWSTRETHYRHGDLITIVQICASCHRGLRCCCDCFECHKCGARHSREHYKRCCGTCDSCCTGVVCTGIRCGYTVHEEDAEVYICDRCSKCSMCCSCSIAIKERNLNLHRRRIFRLNAELKRVENREERKAIKERFSGKGHIFICCKCARNKEKNDKNVTMEIKEDGQLRVS